MLMVLPDLVLRTSDWKTYIAEIHQVYLETVSRADLRFNGLPVRDKYFPSDEGKAATFWHLITQGKVESERTPDERRCQRIRWVSWMIASANTNPQIEWWENTRKGNVHVVIWIRSENFAVILAKRTGYYLLKSAYWVQEHRAVDFEKELREYRASNS
jgi:hypothetical protein